MIKVARRRVAVVGIGNDLAGDDGAGLEVIRLLEPAWGQDERVLLARLEGDLFAVADLLHLAYEFIFADAVAGETPGESVRCTNAPRAFSPSFHQTDIQSVMRALESLGVSDPFPRWEVWGVTTLPPQELRSGLSAPVARAVNEVARSLDVHLRELLGEG